MIINQNQLLPTPTIILLFVLLMCSVSFILKLSVDLNDLRAVTNSTTEFISTVIPPLKAGSIKPVVAEEVKKPVNNQELQCMAENIYREAGTQSPAGKMAVGYVVLNRMSSRLFPHSVCGVVHQSQDNVCQFSWVCEENLLPINMKSSSWKQSVDIAYALLSVDKKSQVDITGGATYFHEKSLQTGYKITPVAVIDNHVFYKR
jgi:spore germination cell wall hydrolase CwlJ-like protein